MQLIKINEQILVENSITKWFLSRGLSDKLSSYHSFVLRAIKSKDSLPDIKDSFTDDADKARDAAVKISKQGYSAQLKLDRKAGIKNFDACNDGPITFEKGRLTDEAEQALKVIVSQNGLDVQEPEEKKEDPAKNIAPKMTIPVIEQLIKDIPYYFNWIPTKSSADYINDKRVDFLNKNHTEYLHIKYLANIEERSLKFESITLGYRPSDDAKWKDVITKDLSEVRNRDIVKHVIDLCKDWGLDTIPSAIVQKNIIDKERAEKQAKVDKEQKEKSAEAEKEQKQSNIKSELRNLRDGLIGVCPEDWAPNKVTTTHFTIGDDEYSIVVNYTISDNGIEYTDIKYLKGNEVVKTKDLSNIDEDAVNAVILKQASKWLEPEVKPEEKSAEAEQNQEQEQENSEDQANAEEQPQENNEETQQQNQQQNPQETQPLPTNVQNDLTPQNKKKPISYINAKDNTLNVKKNDYAIGQDGKLRLVKKNDANYKTTDNGKAVRNLHLSRGLRNVLRNLELMEGRNINEADDVRASTDMKDADVDIFKSTDIFDTWYDRIDSLEESLADSIAEVIENSGKNYLEVAGKLLDKKPAAMTFDKELKDLKEKILSAKKAVESMSETEKELLKELPKDVNDKSEKPYTKNAQTAIDAAAEINQLFNTFNNITAINDKNIDDVIKNYAKTIEEISSKFDALSENIKASGNKYAKASDKKKESEGGLPALYNVKKALGLEITDDSGTVVEQGDSIPAGIQSIFSSQSFQNELEVYGSQLASNNFIKFLKLLKDSYREIWSKIDKTYYGMLHNIVVNKKLTSAEIAKGMSTGLECKLPLLSEDFYSIPFSEAKKILELFGILSNLNEYYLDDVTPATPGEIVDGYTIPQAGKIAKKELANIIYKNNSLRAIANAQIIYNNIFGEEIRKKKQSLGKPAEVLAKALNCKEEDLKTKEGSLIAAIYTLISKARVNNNINNQQEVNLLAKLNKRPLENHGIIKDPNNIDWIRIFGAVDEIDYKTLQNYVDTVATIIYGKSK